MADITKVKDTLSECGFVVTGAAQENNTKIVDASTLNNAITGLTFHHLMIRELSWSINGGAYMTLTWEGSPNKPFLYLSGSGTIEFSDRMGIKIPNTATSATGDILLSTSAASPYSLILVLEKTSGSYDKSEKFNN